MRFIMLTLALMALISTASVQEENEKALSGEYVYPGSRSEWEDKCSDAPGWSTDEEEEHFNCDAYDGEEMCAYFGDKVSRNGCTPNQACCMCGGGNVICSDTVPVLGYTCHSKSCVSGNNIIKFKDHTRKECAQACNSEDSCEGFEYGVNHGGEGTDYNSRDCQLKSSAEMDDCDGAFYNLDFCVKNQEEEEEQHEYGYGYGYGEEDEEKINAATENLAGEYQVWYKGKKRSTNMIINCDNSVTQPGAFTDELHFDHVKAKCTHDRDSGATMYILNTHGKYKHECLHASDDGDGVIKGYHYIKHIRIWGKVEYRPITKKQCVEEEGVGVHDDGYSGLNNIILLISIALSAILGYYMGHQKLTKNNEKYNILPNGAAEENKDSGIELTYHTL